jgi:hypothetical protein
LIYLTNGAESDQDFDIHRAIHADHSLRNEYDALQQTLADLENFNLSPNDRIMENIMAALGYEKNAHAV